ncbi:MAG: acyl carrier protein [Bacteroidetes bacterium]|nr:acyl carrier protein [Bacteroidota bacterium]
MKTREEILPAITEVLQKVFSEPELQVTSDTSAADIDKWTSLTHIELIAEVEKKFSIRIPLKDVVRMKNVGELADCVKKLITL